MVSYEVTGRPKQALTAAQAFEVAVALHRQQRRTEAEPVYRAILMLQPDHFGALQNLGLLCSEMGRAEEGLQWLNKAVRCAPHNSSANNNLGSVLAGLGHHEDAIRAYHQALDNCPGDADTLINLGASLHALGRHLEAIDQLETALAAKPDSAEAHNNLGNAVAALGRPADAVVHYQQALALRPEFAEAHNNLARALGASDRSEEAIAHYEKAIALKPDYVAAHENLAHALLLADREADAIRHYEAALSIEPDRADNHNNVGQILSKLHQGAEAEDHFRKAIALQPNFVAAHVNLGHALNSSERTTEALEQFARALSIDGASAAAYHGIGTTKQSLGLLAEARTAFERAIELSPRAPEFYLGIADIKRFTRDDPHLAAMEDLSRDMSSFAAEEQIALDFALGKVYADIEDHARSFAHLLQANARKRKTLAYDEAATLAMFPHIEEVFTKDLLQRTAGLGNPSTVPIFIVGMPRSGTTLLEQMLASHPGVHGAGELNWIGEAARRFRGNDVRGFFPEVAATPSVDQLRELGQHYIEHLRSKSATATRITDKMPMNFRFVGLIHMMLPHARIIHARRDPVDTCLSCFSKNFSGGIEYAFDLGELGRYWRAYDKLMQHWRQVIPESAMLEVQYENLVADFESHARRIISFCGLDWDDRCLAFHKTQRPVRTASVSQVRQPIYQSSVGRSQPYKAKLQPLFDALA